MGRFKLAFGLHNHQPVGNFDSVFHQAHEQAYKPFLKAFGRFEKLKMSLHQSGILWKWQEENDIEYFDMVQKLIYNDQLELMTGGFYEPILPSIPDRDKLGQIEQLGRYLEGQFAYDATGLWLTERVWEPHLPKILKRAGIQYLPIDDTHFLYSGFNLDELTGIFLTEEEGYTIKLLPIRKKLRYLIPFGKVEEVIDELKRMAEKNPNGLAIYADDGEKFGVWPKTYEHCYADGWLEDFFAALTDNSDWLEVCTLREAAQTDPVGRAYLPSASYAEMLHWSLPPKAYIEFEEFGKWLEKSDKMEQYGRFVRGGHWRGFIAKYDEVNLMHKKMLAVSDKLERFKKSGSGTFDQIDQAKQHLYAAQCNCPYWHGVFGGLYLSHIRGAVFENLIQAENLITPKSDTVIQKSTDFDCDGYPEIVVTTNKFYSVLKPSCGGMMIELDSRKAEMNLTDTLTRRREGYHRKLADAKLDGEKSDKTESIHDSILTKEKGLEKFLAEDWYLRRCFIDHFLKPDVDLEKFSTGTYGDDGDFVLEPWETLFSSDPGIVKLRRQGNLWREDGVKPLTIEKAYYFAADSDVITINYALTAGENIPSIRFAVENNFNFYGGRDDRRCLLFDGKKKGDGFLEATEFQPDCRKITIRDERKDIDLILACDNKAEIWQLPINTISLSEGGFEKVYQGTSIVNIFNLNLKKNKPLELSFLLFCGNPKNVPPRLKAKAIKAARVT
jgi:4-alpha-glucanotransferase